jgi:DNA-binding winged helix-turn-helix (wHTH) protein
MVEPAHGGGYRFGAFELHPAERRLLKDGEPVVVGPRAFDCPSSSRMRLAD